MADEIKNNQQSNQSNDGSSSIKKIKEPDFSKEVTIDRLFADRQAIDMQFQRMKKEFGEKLSDNEIQQRIHNMVIRDNIFNAAMHILVPCYEINIAAKDLQNLINTMINADPRLKNAPYEYVKSSAQRIMEKEMLFMVLSKEWNITVTDEELREKLNEYYKQTNNPIRDILNSKERMESAKKTLLDQKIADAICNKLKFRMDNEAIRKNAEASRKAMEEALAKAQKNTTIADNTSKSGKK